MGDFEVVVVGPGAIGSSVAAALAQVGSTPLVVSRTPVGRLDVTVGDSRITVDVESLTDPGDAPTADVMILAVKAHQTASVSPWLHALAPATVFILQNGVEHVERVEPQPYPARLWFRWWFRFRRQGMARGRRRCQVKRD
jgi:2-dehydropantoate 2-reductase